MGLMHKKNTFFSRWYLNCLFSSFSRRGCVLRIWLAFLVDKFVDRTRERIIDPETLKFPLKKLRDLYENK